MIYVYFQEQSTYYSILNESLLTVDCAHNCLYNYLETVEQEAHQLRFSHKIDAV